MYRETEPNLRPSEFKSDSLPLLHTQVQGISCFSVNHIQMRVRSSGWIGIGFSANGNMINADIHVGWVKDGEVFIKVNYAVFYLLLLMNQALCPCLTPQHCGLDNYLS